MQDKKSMNYSQQALSDSQAQESHEIYEASIESCKQRSKRQCAHRFCLCLQPSSTKKKEDEDSRLTSVRCINKAWGFVGKRDQLTPMFYTS